MPNTSIFCAVSTRRGCLFLVAAGSGRWDGAVQSLRSSKDSPLFFFANGAIPLGLILAHLYAFVLSKCMCVFSPLLFLLCVADSSQDLTESSHCRAACQALPFIYPFSSPPNGLLLHPRLLTGLPGTTERISTQIKQLCSRGAKDLKPD